MTDLNPTRPLRLRFPLSDLSPTRDVSRLAERARAILRHPRSRIRITPQWRPPHVMDVLGGVLIDVHVTRRRVSPAFWERACETPAPSGQPLFFITLCATCSAESAEGVERTLDSEVRSLFKQLRGHSWAMEMESGQLNRQGQYRWMEHSLMIEADLESMSPAAHKAA